MAAVRKLLGRIYQREIDPATGLLLAGNTAVTNLATRPGVSGDPVEGSNLVKKNGYYYLFVSFDSCCPANPADSNYKIAIGRSSSPQEPFLDRNGTSMLNGGGTVLLQGNGATWNGPGGSTVLTGAPGGDAIAYHALNLAQNGSAYLLVNSLSWSGDNWPVINQ